jgi:hypothetical protein
VKGGDNFGDLAVDGRIIQKWILTGSGDEDWIHAVQGDSNKGCCEHSF